MPENAMYQLGGAAFTGLAAGWLKDQPKLPWFDILMAGGLGAVGYLLSTSMRGTSADLGIGMMNGAAGYIGGAAMDIIKGPAPTGRRVALSPVSVSYTPATPAYASSVVEI